MTQRAEIHVSPSGDDANPGTSKRPLQTIRAALDAARDRLSSGAKRAEVRLAEGPYNLAQPLAIGPELSGLSLCAEGGQAVLTGVSEPLAARPATEENLPLAPETRGQLWEIDLPAGQFPQALYANGRRRPRAMWPKHDRWEEWPQCAPGANRRELSIPREMQRGHTCTGDIVLNVLPTPYTRWTNYLVRVESADGERVTVSRPLTPNDFLQPADTIPLRIENALETLTEPGEWCVDSSRGRIFYRPTEDESLEETRFAVPRVSTLIGLEGTEDNPVRDVRIDGLRLTRNGAEGAAIEPVGTTDCLLTGCVFEDIEGQAVRADGYTRRLHVTGCRIDRCGSGGIALTAPQCAGREIGGGNLIERNEIARCGRSNWHASGISIGGSGHNVVRDNHLHDLPYAAIAIGGVRLIFALTRTVRDWPAEAVPLDRIVEEHPNIETFKRYVCGHNTVENNRIEDVMMRLDDGGAIYCHASHHNTVRGNTVRRTHRARSHGLYFDDDEVHSTMEGNTVIDSPWERGGKSSIHVHDNALNTVCSNKVLGSWCPFTFPSSYGGHRMTGNTFVMKEGAAMPTPPERNSGRYEETRWDAGENVVDDNVYWSEDNGRTAKEVLRTMRECGYDANSRIEEPELRGAGAPERGSAGASGMGSAGETERGSAGDD